MARREQVTVNGKEYTLQSVSPSWYLKQSDTYGMSGGGRRDTPGYVNSLLRNVVVEPAGVCNKGLSYFDDIEDLDAVEQLVPVIERFLRGATRPVESGVQREA